MEPYEKPLRFTFDKINSLLRLDEETGNLYWKIPGRGRQMKKPAGSMDNRGYITLTIDFERVRAHSLVWLLHTGHWPVNELDHINHRNWDNRPVNLRDVTRSENNLNRKCINKYGYPGVYYSNGSYRATHVRKLLGRFKTPEEAIAAIKSYEVSINKERLNA